MGSDASWWGQSDDAGNIRAVHAALYNGITTFDTAEGYGGGHSEQVLGEALKGARSKAVIATKASKANLKSADLRNALERSLKNLKTDYVDLYYIHWPNPEIPLEETMGQMMKLKGEGLIRAVGVSNFSASLLESALAFGRIEAVQPEYSLLQRDIEKDLIPFCLEHSISVASYSSIAKGILTGRFHLGGNRLKSGDFRSTRRLFLKEHMEKEAELILLMKKLADEKSASVSQIAIAWLLKQKGLATAIIGTQSEKHLLENVKALDIDLTEEEAKKLSDVSSNVIASIDSQER
jgi:aryl-alcohol dehydrogenase-like predicted oxidoreductase